MLVVSHLLLQASITLPVFTFAVVAELIRLGWLS